MPNILWLIHHTGVFCQKVWRALEHFPQRLNNASTSSALLDPCARHILFQEAAKSPAIRGDGATGVDSKHHLTWTRVDCVAVSLKRLNLQA